MPNKIGLLVAIATVTLTQSVGLAQDFSTLNVSADLYNQNLSEASSSSILTAQKIANSIHVKKIKFIRNKILSSSQINTIIEPLHGRAVSFAQLQEAANQITRLYHNYGYTNFKGIIPKQLLNDGIIEIHIIEERYLCYGNTYDCSTLRLMLQQAVEVENWNRAIEIVDKLIQASPQEAQQLREYKTQLQNRLSKTSTSTTQKVVGWVSLRQPN